MERPSPNSRTRDMAHSYVWHESWIHVPWLIHTCARTDSYLLQSWSAPYQIPEIVAWLIRMCDIMSYWYMCHDSFIRVPWLNHIYYRTREQHNEFAHMWQICKMRLWGHGIFIYVQWCIHTNVPWLIYTCTMTYLILLLITTHSYYLLQN